MATFEETAQQIAFDAFISESDGLSAEAALELSDDEWSDRILVWEPFEDWNKDEVTAVIDDLATSMNILKGA